MCYSPRVNLSKHQREINNARHDGAIEELAGIGSLKEFAKEANFYKIMPTLVCIVREQRVSKETKVSAWIKSDYGFMRLSPKEVDEIGLLEDRDVDSDYARMFPEKVDKSLEKENYYDMVDSDDGSMFFPHKERAGSA